MLTGNSILTVPLFGKFWGHLDNSVGWTRIPSGASNYTLRPYAYREDFLTLTVSTDYNLNLRLVKLPFNFITPVFDFPRRRCLSNRTALVINK